MLEARKATLRVEHGLKRASEKQMNVMERKNNFNIYRFCFICLDYGQETFSNTSTRECGKWSNNQIVRLKTIYKRNSNRLNSFFFLYSILCSAHDSQVLFRRLQIRSTRRNHPFDSDKSPV